MNREKFLKVTPIALLILVFYIRFFIGWGYILGTGESALPFYNIGSQLVKVSRAWYENLLGGTTSYSSASLTFYSIISLLDTVLISNFLVQLGVFLLLLLISFFSLHCLFGEIFDKKKEIPAYLFAILYWFNPLVMTVVWNRFLYNFMFFWAFLPLALVLVIRGIKTRKYSYAAILSLSSVLFSFALSSPVFIILFFASVVGAVLLYFYLFRVNYAFILKYFSVILLSFFLFNYWWISQLVLQYTTPVFSRTVEEFYSGQGNVGTLNLISSLSGRLSYVFRLLDYRFIDRGPSWASYLGNFFVTPLLYFPFLIIFYTIHKHRKDKRVLFLATLLIFSIFLLKGSSDPFGGIFLFVFSKINFLQVFRNPFEKFSFLVILFSSLLLSYGWVKIEFNLSGRLKKIFMITSAFTALLWIYPFVTGYVFSGEAGFINKTDPYTLKVPEYYKDADNWLKGEEGVFRFISLPINGEGITYNWKEPYAGVELTSTLITTPNISFNSTIPFYNEFVSGINNNQMSEAVLEYAPLTASRYFMIRKDIDYKARKMAEPETIRERFDNYQQSGVVKRSRTFGDLTFYKLQPPYLWEKVYTTGNIIVSNETDVAKVLDGIDGYPESKLAIFYPDVFKGGSTISEIIYPGKVVEVTNQLDLYQNLTKQELIDKLVYIKHSPDELIYPIIRLAEKFRTPSKNDYLSWVMYKTDILGKRMVETISFPEVQKRGGVKDLYIKDLEDLQVDLVNVSSGAGGVAEYVRTSLLTQYELARRYEPEITEKLRSLLIEMNVLPHNVISSDDDYLTYEFFLDKQLTATISGIPRNVEFYVDGVRKINDEVGLGEGLHDVSVAYGNRYFSSEYEPESLEVDENSDFNRYVDIPDLPTTYELSFDSRFELGNSFSIEFLQNVDPEEEPLFRTTVSKLPDYHEWRNHKFRFTTSQGAESGLLIINPTEDFQCKKYLLIFKRCEKVTVPYHALINNLKLVRVDYPNIKLISGETSIDTIETNSVVDYKMIDPTQYRVNIRKINSIPETLVFSELYHDGWHAYYGDGTELKDHALVNVYANSWKIDKPGEYTVMLKYLPQMSFELAKKISLITISLGVVLVVFIRKKYETD